MYTKEKRYIVNGSALYTNSSQSGQTGFPPAFTHFSSSKCSTVHIMITCHLRETQPQCFSTFHIWQFQIEVIRHKRAEVWLIRLRCIKTPLYVASMVFAVGSVDTDSVFVVALTSSEVYNLWCCALLWVYQCLLCLRMKRGFAASLLLLPPLVCANGNCRRPLAISSNESQNVEG